MRAKIKEKTQVANATLLVVFDLLGQEVSFRPGQYFFVTLPGKDENGEPLRKHFSVVVSPQDQGVLGLATRIRNSAFKQTLASLPVGTEVEVEEPKGSFLLPEETDRPLVFVAGGIGITVFRSMLRYIDQKQLPYNVTLIYSNRDQESTPFLEELQALDEKLGNFRLILTMTQDSSWTGESRRIDAQFFKDYLGAELNQYHFLVAGPPGMVEGMENELEKAGVAPENVSSDSFSGY